jgi:hypothetical protein
MAASNPELINLRPAARRQSRAEQREASKARIALRDLETEARYARERVDLYRVGVFTSRPMNTSRLRDLERRALSANCRLARAKASARSSAF